MSKPFIQPYLFFGGRCEEALEFYRQAVGAEVGMLMKYKDSPEPLPPDRVVPGFEDKVMHTEFTIGDSRIMASDGCGDADTFGGFSLSLNVATAEEATKYFNALAEGGQITMPLSPTFWSPSFGMLTDRFGMGWMVSTVAAQ